MPVVSFEVEREGLAERFVENLRGNAPTMLDSLTEQLRSEIAAESPPRTTYVNPKAGDVKLSESFYTIQAQEIEKGVWESGVASQVPAKARSLEYGSGAQGGGGEYPITPKQARLLSFYWENAPGHMGGAGRYFFKRVSHPGVRAYGYIRGVLERYRPLLAQKFGEAIRLSLVR